MKKKPKFNFFDSPSHGWLEIPSSLFLDFKKRGYEASQFSYVDNKKFVIYLEEDCDAPAFLKKAEELGIEFEIENQHINNDTFIRSLGSYKPS